MQRPICPAIEIPGAPKYRKSIVSTIAAVYFRAHGAVRRIAIEIGVPKRDPAIMERLFREKLAMLSDPLDPGFGFDLIRLCAVHVERISSEIFDLNARTNEKAEISFSTDRLVARFGSHRILAFRPLDMQFPKMLGSLCQHSMCGLQGYLGRKPGKQKMPRGTRNKRRTARGSCRLAA